MGHARATRHPDGHGRGPHRGNRRGISVAVPGRVAAASGTTLFVQSFANNTINSSYPVALPALPSDVSGTNVACLTASGNPSTGVLHSCPTNNDRNGSGKLRLTAATTSPGGRRLRRDERPDVPGHRRDLQHLPVRRHRRPTASRSCSPRSTRPTRCRPRSSGSPAARSGTRPTPAQARSAWPTRTWASASTSTATSATARTRGPAAPTPPTSATAPARVPGQVVVRGPGNGTVGYCAINSTATTTTSPRAHAPRVHPGRVGGPGRGRDQPHRRVVHDGVGHHGRLRHVQGGVHPGRRVGHHADRHAADRAAPGLYPSSSWTTSAGIPKQLAFGWVGLHRGHHRLPRG